MATRAESGGGGALPGGGQIDDANGLGQQQPYQPYLVGDDDASALQDGNALRIFHEGSPLCFDLDHYVHKQGLSEDFLTQSIAMSQSIFRVTVQETKCTSVSLMRFYSQRNPEKCSDVPMIVDKYAGDARALLGGLRQKYGTLNPRDLSLQTVWLLQSTMSGTYLTSADVDDPRATSAAYLKAHETTGLTPAAAESFVVEASDEPMFFHLRSLRDGYLVVEGDSGYVASTGSRFEASKFQLMSPGFQRPNLQEMMSSAAYRTDYDRATSQLAQSIIASGDAAAAAAAAAAHVSATNKNSTLLLPASNGGGAVHDGDEDDWEMVQMTDKMTDDVLTVSTFEYQRRYPFQGWLPLMLPTDPPAWSDETGRLYLPLSSFTDTKGWMWTTDWAVDLFRYQDEEHTPGSGKYSSEAANLTSIASAASHHIDDAGWEYANARITRLHGSSDVSDTTDAGVAEPSTGGGFRFGPKKKFSVLRRRKWIRRRCKVQEFDQSLYQSQQIFGTLGQAAQQQGLHSQDTGAARKASSKSQNDLKKKAQATLRDFKSGMKNFWGAVTTSFKPAKKQAAEEESRMVASREQHKEASDRDQADSPLHTDAPDMHGPGSNNEDAHTPSGGRAASVSAGAETFVTAATLREKALNLLRGRQCDEALQVANAAVDADSSDSQAFRIRAAIKLQLNDSVAALTDANYSIALDSSAAAGYLLKADALYRLRQYERARESAVTSLSIAAAENQAGSTTTLVSAGEEVIPGAQNLLKRIDQKLGAVTTNTEPHTSRDSTEAVPDQNQKAEAAPAAQHALQNERSDDAETQLQSQHKDTLLNGDIFLPRLTDDDAEATESDAAAQDGLDHADMDAGVPNGVDLTASLVMGEPSHLELSQSLYESFRSNGDEDGDSSSDDDV